MFRGLTFDQQQVLAQHDGRLYSRLFNDGRLLGCEIAPRANEIIIAPGMLVCSGRLISNEGSTTVDVLNPTAGFMRLVLQIDLTAPSSFEEFEQVSTFLEFQQTALFPQLRQDDINSGTGTIYQMELGVFSISGGQIVGTHRVCRYVGTNGLEWIPQEETIEAAQRCLCTYYLQVTGERGYPESHDNTISPNFRAIITGVKE